MNRNAQQGWIPLLLILCLGLLISPAPLPADPGDITFAPPYNVPLASTGSGVQDPADLDGDGHLDVFGSIPEKIFILYGHGDGTFDPPLYLTAPAGPMADVEAGDLDGNGSLDLVYSLPDAHKVVTLRNLGARSWEAGVFYDVPGSPFGIHLADLTKDGSLDMAVANDLNNKMTVMYNNGSGQFPTRNTYNGGTWPSRVTSGDWDHDGDRDLAMSNYGSGNVLIYSNNGTGGFTQTGNYATGYYAAQVMAADFNRDGHLDLVTGNTFAHTVSILLGNGNGTFSLLETIPGNQYPHILKVADLDGDTYPDVVSPNNGTNYFTVFGNQAGTAFQKLPTFASTGDDLRTLGVGDLDEDGRTDVVTGHGSHGWLCVFLNTTNLSLPAAPALTSATAVSYKRVDLAWQDESANETRFRVERRAASEVNFTVVGQVERNQVSFSDLTVAPDTPYVYRVRAVNGLGPSDPSNEKTATTPPLPVPTPPVLNSATAISTQRVNLAWTDQSDVEALFSIERRLSSEAQFTEVGQAPQNATTFSDLTVSGETSCVYRVRAVNSSGASAPSNERSVTTPVPPPQQPGTLQASEETPGRVRLTWTDPNSVETGYRVERQQQNSATVQTWDLPPDTTEWVDDNNTPHREYAYRVRAVRGALLSTAASLLHLTRPAAPQGLAATAVSQTAINLTWTHENGAGVDAFVERSADGGQTWTVRLAPGVSPGSFIDTGLAKETSYRYRVRCQNVTGDSPYTGTVDETTFPDPPTAPSGLQVSPVPTTGFLINWLDTAAGETHFRLERKVGAVFQQVIQVPTGTTSYLHASLPGNTVQTYRLRAVNRGGVSPPTTEVTARSLPLPPTGLSVQAVVSGRLDLSWTDGNPSGSPSATQVERSADGGATFQAVATVDAGVTTYRDAAVSPETEYAYRLRGSNESGFSTPTAPVTRRSLPLPPAAPGGFQVLERTQTLIKVGWTPPAAGPGGASPTGYRLERQTAPDTWQTAGTASSSATSLEVGGLQPDTAYTFRLFAFNAGGDSPAAGPLATSTLPAPPNAPAGLTVEPGGEGELVLSWSLAPGATGYRVERRLPGEGGFTPVAQVGAVAAWTDSGLPEVTRGTYRLFALNAGGEAGPAEQSAVTRPLAPGSPAAAPRVREVDVTWTDRSSAETGYQVERRLAGAGAFQPVGTVGPNVTRLRHGGLDPGASYEFRVVTLGPNGNSLPVNAGGVTVPPNSAGAKVKVSPTSLNFGSLIAPGSRGKVLKIKNTGQEPVTVSISDPASPFRLAPGESTFTLAPKATRTVTVLAEPATPGSLSGSLAVTTTATRMQLKTVPLKVRAK